jgi:hypothetical protein
MENLKNSLRSPSLRMLETPLQRWPVAIPSSKAEAEIKLCAIAFFPDQLQPSTFDNESTSSIARQHATNSDSGDGDGKEHRNFQRLFSEHGLYESLEVEDLGRSIRQLCTVRN